MRKGKKPLTAKIAKEGRKEREEHPSGHAFLSDLCGFSFATLAVKAFPN
jgi:hypothetical protein